MPSNPLVRLLAALPLLITLAPASSRADALPPPRPLACAAGSHVVHDHGGTHCVQDAPTSCPVGWVGREGGVCTLDLCAEDASCAGRRCKEVDLCAFDDPARLRWGATEPVPPGPVSLLGAPPSPRPARVFSGPCGAGGACSSSETCRRAGVCLPGNATAPAPAPKNASPAVTFGDRNGTIPDFRPRDAGAAPDPGSVVDPAETPAGVEPAVPASPERPPPAAPRPGKAGGCAGCATTDARASDPWLVLFVGALVVAALRRRVG